MNRYKFLEEPNPDENKFRACPRCGLLFKKDYACCKLKPVEIKPSDRIPARPKVARHGPNRLTQEVVAPFDQIWSLARKEMDEPLEEEIPDWDEEFDDE